MILSIFLISIFIFIAIAFSKNERVRCLSKTCNHNYKGRCIQDKVIIYDNTGIQGLCLRHSAKIADRVKVAIDNSQNKKVNDENAIKSPKEFEKWMINHWKDQK